MYRARARISPRLVAFALAGFAVVAPLAAQARVDVTTIEKIKSEEMSRSQVMELMSWLSDVYGPRLTWSPNVARARDWAIGFACVLAPFLAVYAACGKLVAFFAGYAWTVRLLGGLPWSGAPQLPQIAGGVGGDLEDEFMQR